MTSNGLFDPAFIEERKAEAAILVTREDPGKRRNPYLFDGRIYRVLSEDDAKMIIFQYLEEEISELGHSSILPGVLAFLKAEPSIVDYFKNICQQTASKVCWHTDTSSGMAVFN